MDINRILNSGGLVIAFVFLLLFSLGYNFIVDRFQRRTQRFTAEFVVGGVLVTVTTSGFFIGWDNALIVIILFVASGLPMIIGSWVRSARDDEQAKQIAKESLK